MFWSLLCEVEYASIERIVLEILEEASMKVVRSGPGGERNVADLRKLSIVVKRCDLQFRDPFRGGVGICPGSAVEDVRRRDAIDRETHHIGRRAANRNISLTVLLHVRRSSQCCQWAGGRSTEIQR
jgi:hypothetical protein